MSDFAHSFFILSARTMSGAAPASPVCAGGTQKGTLPPQKRYSCLYYIIERKIYKWGILAERGMYLKGYIIDLQKIIDVTLDL